MATRLSARSQNWRPDCYPMGRSLNVVWPGDMTATVPDDLQRVAEWLLTRMRESGCDRLVVDAGSLPCPSSELLSLLLLIRSHGPSVGIREASPYLLEVLATTHLDQFIAAASPGEELEAVCY